MALASASSSARSRRRDVGADRRHLIAGTSAGDWAVFTTSGATITINNVDGVPVSVVGSFAANVPWQGMATTNAGGRGFLAGNGVYVLDTANGYAELGVKLR